MSVPGMKRKSKEVSMVGAERVREIGIVADVLRKVTGAR